MRPEERAEVILNEMKPNEQLNIEPLKKRITDMIISAQFSAVESCIAEAINTKQNPKDTFKKFRTRIIKNLNSVKNKYL